MDRTHETGWHCHFRVQSTRSRPGDVLEDIRLLSHDFSLSIDREFRRHEFYQIKCLSWVSFLGQLDATCLRSTFRNFCVYRISRSTSEVKCSRIFDPLCVIDRRRYRQNDSACCYRVICVPLSWRAYLARKTSSASIFTSSKVHLARTTTFLTDREANPIIWSTSFCPRRATSSRRVRWPIAPHGPVFAQWLDDIFSLSLSFARGCSRAAKAIESTASPRDCRSAFRAFPSKAHRCDLNHRIRFGAFRRAIRK